MDRFDMDKVNEYKCDVWAQRKLDSILISLIIDLKETHQLLVRHWWSWLLSESSVGHKNESISGGQ